MLGSKGTIHSSRNSCWGQGSSAPSSNDCSSIEDAFECARRAATEDGEPAPGEADWTNPWHSLLYEGLRDRALPAVISDGTITPAASLWTGSRLWLDAFRDAGLKTGDRIIISVPPSAVFVQVVAAALWQGLTLVMLPPGENVGKHLEDMDARAAIAHDAATAHDAPIAHDATTRTPDEDAPLRHAWRPDGLSGPTDPPETLRDADGAQTPDARFLLRTSGTTGAPTWIALSDRNVLSVLASHMPHLDLQNARTLSVLPWSHAFGLVLDFLPALFSETEIIRDPNGGRDPKELLRLTRAWGATHLSAVPLVIDRLSEVEGGPGMLCSLSGGIVGGAPVSGSLAQLLSGTSLRAGYGQTEASPGIALGPPGHWAANYMGQPLGCDIHVDDRGELHFRGDNACLGIWKDRQLHRLDPDRTVATGDKVVRDEDDLFFRGRMDNTFKLSNGRLVAAGHLESKLKQHFHQVDEAFVCSPDGDNIAIAIRLSDANATAPSLNVLRKVIGSIGERLAHFITVDEDDWVTTAKGTVARNAMKDVVQRTFSPADSSLSSSSASSSS